MHWTDYGLSHLMALEDVWELPPHPLFFIEFVCECLVRRSERGLKEVAATVGYRQVSAFVQAFRRRYGLSPGTYRRMRRGEAIR